MVPILSPFFFLISGFLDFLFSNFHFFNFICVDFGFLLLIQFIKVKYLANLRFRMILSVVLLWNVDALFGWLVSLLLYMDSNNVTLSLSADAPYNNWNCNTYSQNWSNNDHKFGYLLFSHDWSCCVFSDSEILWDNDWLCVVDYNCFSFLWSNNIILRYWEGCVIVKNGSS
jgi:hypothetical protein